MSAPTPIEQEEQIARFRQENFRMFEETRKLMEEQHKLLAETRKLDAEQRKLAAESLKFEREHALAPWQIAISGMGTGAGLFAAGAAFWKIFAH
jgi:hypothetical protein